MTPHPSSAGDAWKERVLHLLRSAARVQAELDATLQQFGLTTDRWRALNFVVTSPGASMAEVIDALAMPSTSATRTVDVLVEIGAIFRNPHPNDRRRVTLRASAQGQQLLARAGAAVRARDLEGTLLTPVG